MRWVVTPELPQTRERLFVVGLYYDSETSASYSLSMKKPLILKTNDITDSRALSALLLLAFVKRVDSEGKDDSVSEASRQLGRAKLNSESIKGNVQQFQRPILLISNQAVLGLKKCFPDRICRRF